MNAPGERNPIQLRCDRGSVTLWVIGLLAPMALLIVGIVFDAMMAFNHRADAQDFGWAVASAASAQVVRGDDGVWVIDEPAALHAAERVANTMTPHSIPLEWDIELLPGSATVSVDWAYQPVLLDSFNFDGWQGTESATSVAESTD